MRLYDLIVKKRDGLELSKQEIEFIIHNFVEGNIPDYQMSAFLMAVYLKGMSNQEVSHLTMAMAESGDTVDLSSISGIKADKHSTGGVGDKTTLIVAPIVASCGVKMAKMSGRGLGYTGGTIDKLESIPNFRTNLSQSEFFEQVNTIGLALMSQSGNITPADKMIYALRDVTATVESIPLIASSIMSKKLAAGADCIVLDVKVGTGAFMKDLKQGIELAQTMVSIGQAHQKKVSAILTSMDNPLGYAVGNSLEVIEAMEVLKGKDSEDLQYLCKQLAAQILYLSEKGTLQECFEMVEQSISSGKAFALWKKMIAAQGGDISVLEDYTRFSTAKYIHSVSCCQEGYISQIDAEKIGMVSLLLGAGREIKDSKIDFEAGVLFHKQVGDSFTKGEILATLYTQREETILPAEQMLLSAYTFQKEKPVPKPLLLATVTQEGVEYF